MRCVASAHEILDMGRVQILVQILGRITSGIILHRALGGCDAIFRAFPLVLPVLAV